MEQNAVQDAWSTVVTYLKNLCFGIEYKVMFATAMAFFTDVLGGHIVVMYGFFALATVDLCMGVLRAVVFQNFQTRMLGKWMVKMATQLLLACVIVLFVHMLSLTSGVTIVIVNWLFLLFALNDLCSIVSKVESLGFRLPIPIKVVLDLLRRRSMFGIAQYLKMPEMREQIEHELERIRNEEAEVCGKPLS